MKRTIRTYPEEIRLAIEMAVYDLPNSILPELLALFEPEVVVKLIKVYSGKTITFPKIETLWKNYRNRVIKRELDKKNDGQTRIKLALKFEISRAQVSNIYSYMRKRKKPKISEKRIETFTKRLVEAEKDKLMKEFKEILEHKKIRRY